MNVPYAESGRTRQKARTRQALIDATRELVASGDHPSVEQAADAAGVSRTTAYRYFPNQHELLIAAHPIADANSLLGDDPPGDPAARLEIVMRELTAQIVADEPQMRAMLRLSLDPQPPDPGRLVLRQGRAIGWIEEALEPLRGSLSGGDLERLVFAIRAAAGIEAFVWLTDIADRSPKEATDVMRWSARSLLRAALAE